MFYHNFKYSLKILLKNKMLIFWTFAFPIILGSLFKMAFSDIENNEKLDTIDIAIIQTEEFNNNQIYKKTYEELSNKNNKNKLFNIYYIKEKNNLESKKKANQLLEQDKIVGYLFLENKKEIIVKTSGINQTVFKYVTEEIIQTEKIITNLIKEGMSSNSTDQTINQLYEKIYDKVLSINENNTILKDTTNTNLSYTMIEFYTLIAMTCLYGGILAMTSINNNLANMSSKGKRIFISPTKKYKTIISSVLASYIVQLIGLFILFIYTVVVLKVDYGNNFPLIILLALIGSLAGLSLGVFTSCVFKNSENTKTGIIISLTMLGCFLSGMMGITMKYVIDKNVPIINKLNPANMITDGFYSLYYYDTLDRYYFNIISLIIFAMILIVISTFSLRRQKYDSI